MNCFLFPKKVCRELEGIIRQFWWGQQGGDKKINWLAWKKMCVSKFQGGMGFRDLEAFNLVLLAKQGWRLLHDSEYLFAKVFMEKYFSNCSFLQAKVKQGCSYVWRSTATCRSVLEQGSKWCIGNGSRISIRHDRWIPDQSNTKIPYPIDSLNSEARVADLIDLDRGVWLEDVVQRCFSQVDADQILKYPLHQSSPEDVLIWWGTPSGLFTVKSAYHNAITKLQAQSSLESSNHMEMQLFWKALWSMKLPRKVLNFVWRLCRNILPTRDNLDRHNIYTPLTCPICEYELEPSIHVFGQCVYARKVWEC